MKNRKILSIVLILAMLVSMTIGLNPTMAYADTTVSTWSELSDAVNAAPTDGTETVIEVGANFNADSIMVIPNGVNIVIQSATGGPYTITREAGYTGTIFGIQSGEKLTFKNITLDGNAANVTADFAIVYVWGGEFTMDAGATIQNAKGDISGNSAGVCLAAGSIMNMKSSAVIQNVENIAAYGYGSLLIDGILNMDGGTITGCKGVYGGGIVSNSSGTINMSGGSVTGNTSDYGGMYVRGTFNLSGAPDISGNKKSDNTTDCNLYLYNGYVASVTGTLTNTTAIGITTSNTPYTGLPVNITAVSGQDWSGNFTSDNSSYVIQNSGSGSSQVVQLAVSSTINVGDNSGSNLPTGVTYNSGVFTVDSGANGSTITVIGTTTQNVINVAGGVAVTLVLSGASITVPAASTYSPIDLQGSANVTLTLADGTTNIIDADTADDRAGINVNGGATLDINGTGGLFVTGGQYASGIGSDQYQGGGIINISDGIITATAGDYGAGIGGGYQGIGGSITINGGTVNAIGGNYGAGIGGGQFRNGGTILITGGTVTAIGGSNGGAGIGGGSMGAGGTISINGSANVTAIGGSGNTITTFCGAGIGGGGGASGNPDGAGGVINISPSATIKAVAMGIHKPAINAASGSGSVINAQLDSAISSVADTYLKCGVNGLRLPASYRSFAFSAVGDSPISAWSNPACTTKITNIVTTPGGIASIPISATIHAIPTAVTREPAFNLTVDLNGGNGSTVSSTYTSGAAVSINAGTMSGYTFNGWTSSSGGTFGNARNASTTFTMPGNATTITANWTLNPLSYALTVNLDGGNGLTANNSYTSGAAVSIDAGTKSGYIFNGWTSSNGGTFGNAINASTTFTMPGNATTITANWTQNSTGGSGGGGGGSYTPPGTNVIVDNNDYHIGTENKGNTDTTVTVDSNKLNDGISKASEGSNVTIPVSKNINITAQLVVKNVEDMAKKDMTLTIQTGNVSYNLATSAVDTSKITEVLGTTDTKDIPFSVKISNSNAVVNGATVVIAPVEFTITATYKGKTVWVDSFNSYVNRTIEITADQANKITTAVVVEPNGNLRHVPTKVTVIGGKYYAVINSLTNSTYTVIWHPVEFSDVTNHWAKEAINNMGARMVVSGDGNNTYAPDRDITRAEFAAIVVRALGLEASESASSFNDVKDSDWYCGYIETASDYGIITGYDATTFGPKDKITREQAMTMIARAMKITGLKSDLKDSEITALIAGYADGAATSDYATTSIATCLKTGVITGRSSDTIAPKYYITRAEVATIVQRLLQKSELI